MIETTPLERAILDDIRAKTGLAFRKLGGIDFQNHTIATSVLAVLVDWVPKLDDISHRHAVYACFNTPSAYTHLEAIISWWAAETNELALSSLTQTLSLLLKCEDAPRVWRLLHQLPRRPYHYKLLAKLAPCPDIGQKVKEEIVKDLQTQNLRGHDLASVGQVKDPRIYNWFAGQLNSPDPSVRIVAQKVVNQSKALPRDIERSERAPNREDEIFSTECDVAEIKALLAGLTKRFALRIPLAVSNAEFLWSAERDKWLVARSLGSKNRAASLWFRLEDDATVEVVLLGGSPTHAIGRRSPRIDAI